MRQANLYISIKANVEEHGYRTETCCDILHVSRSAYYRWLSGTVGKRTQENERIAEIVEQLHAESPDKGYRRIRDDLETLCSRILSGEEKPAGYERQFGLIKTPLYRYGLGALYTTRRKTR